MIFFLSCLDPMGTIRSHAPLEGTPIPWQTSRRHVSTLLDGLEEDVVVPPRHQGFSPRCIEKELCHHVPDAGSSWFHVHQTPHCSPSIRNFGR